MSRSMQIAIPTAVLFCSLAAAPAKAQTELTAWKYSTYGENYLLLTSLLDGNAHGANARYYSTFGTVYTTYAQLYQTYYGDDYGYSYYAYYFDYCAASLAYRAWMDTGNDNYYQGFVNKYWAYYYSYLSM